MKHLIFLVMLALSIAANAQNNYESAMSSALGLMKEGDMQKAESIFERVSQASKDKWLPHYYIAQINSLLSWNETDLTKLQAKLDKAQKHLNEALTISTNNAELLVMQAQVLTNWVAYDGQSYGMTYSGKIHELYSTALRLQPTNPRAVFCKAEWDMGSAQFFGNDVTPYCEDLRTALELFANFKPETEFMPNWGEQRAEELVKLCSSKQ